MHETRYNLGSRATPEGIGFIMNSRVPVAVYRDEVLPLTQTFIATQLDSMTRLEPLLVGATRADGPTVSVPAWILSEDRGQGHRTLLPVAHVIAFKVTRRSIPLRQRIKSHGSQLVLAHFAQDAYRIMRLCQQLKLPLAVICHGSDVLTNDTEGAHGNWGQRRLAKNWPALINGTAMFFPVCDFVADALVRRGVPSEKIRTHRTGVIVPQLNVMVAADAHVKSKEILFVGRLVPNKGAHHLLCSLAQVPHGVDWHATLVGDGPERQKLESLAARLGITARVRFTGALPHDRVLALMCAARLLCAPSILVESGASEGLSTVTLEAQARALPVIAFGTGGLPEAVKDGISGLLVPPGDENALSAGLVRFLEDDGLVRRIGVSARMRIEEHFDVQKQTGRLERELLGLLE
jgi:colanic acid/amylovoran biosynthesis glycosyltransferase